MLQVEKHLIMRDFRPLSRRKSDAMQDRASVTLVCDIWSLVNNDYSFTRAITVLTLLYNVLRLLRLAVHFLSYTVTLFGTV